MNALGKAPEETFQLSMMAVGQVKGEEERISRQGDSKCKGLTVREM